MRAHRLVLGLEQLIGYLQLCRDLLIRRELDQDVRVVGLALANGRVQRDDYKGVRRMALGQHKDAHNRIILHPVVLGLHRQQQKIAAAAQTPSRM